MAFLTDVSASPVTVCVAILLVAARIRWRNVAPTQVYFNYENILHRKQYWRIASSVLYHESWSHLVLNIIAMWSFKFLEVRFGSAVFMGYTLLLMIANRCMALLIGYADTSNRVRGYFLSSVGYSDVVIAWSTYITVQNFHSVVFILDVFPLSSYILVLALLNLSLLFTSVVNRPLLCYIAMVTGATLGLGFNFLPTYYWAISFIIDASIIFLWSYLAFPISSLSDNREIEANIDQALEDALRQSREIAFGSSHQETSGAGDNHNNSILTGVENL